MCSVQRKIFSSLSSGRRSGSVVNCRSSVSLGTSMSLDNATVPGMIGSFFMLLWRNMCFFKFWDEDSHLKQISHLNRLILRWQDLTCLVRFDFELKVFRHSGYWHTNVDIIFIYIMIENLDDSNQSLIKRPCTSNFSHF